MDWSDGTRYVGEWRNGLMNGSGVLEMWTRERYEGKFIGGRRNGKGRCHFPNGQVYIGRWKDGQPHGKGQFIDPKDGGSKFFGTWVKGARQGPGLLLTGSLMDTDARAPAAADKGMDGEAVSVIYANGEPEQQTVVALDSIQEMLRDYQDVVGDGYEQNTAATLNMEGKFNADDGNASPRTPRRPDFFRTLGIRGSSNSKRKLQLTNRT